MSSEPSNKKGDLGDYHGLVHEYDGIIELDNQLPRWWLFTLFGAVVFAAGYWLYFHSYQRADLPMAAYEKEKAAQLAAEAEQLKLAGEVTPELLTKLSQDPATVEQGKAVFAEICVTCHAEGGRGNIGPNLTDDRWIHGGSVEQVFQSIAKVWPAKGMPPWGRALRPDELAALVSYVRSLQGSTPPNPRAPEGDPFVAEAIPGR